MNLKVNFPTVQTASEDPLLDLVLELAFVQHAIQIIPLTKFSKSVGNYVICADTATVINVPHSIILSRRPEFPH